MNKLHIFTEEKSAAICFESLMENLLIPPHQFQTYHHGGKEGLKKALRTRLPTISSHKGSRILVTIDQDKNSCKKLKEEIEEIIKEKCRSPYKIRIICTELESWFLADLEAIAKAYPRFKPKQHSGKAQMRDVDKIQKPSKKLLEIIPELSGKTRLSKIDVSGKISSCFNLNQNS